MVSVPEHARGSGGIQACDLLESNHGFSALDPQGALEGRDIPIPLFGLAERGLAASTLNVNVSALRCFYKLTLRRSVDFLREVPPRSRQAVRRPQAFELIVGASVDPLFGPVILFGAGGTAVEVLADRSLALPPLNAPLARALVQRTRVARLLAGFRDVPPADLDAVAAVLERVSDLLAEIPEMAELDINPLLADANGVIAVDARVRVSAARPGGAAHFAVRPYPAELVERFEWQGRTVTLRPIRPEDEARHLAFLQRLDPVDVRMRIFHSRRSIERTELARLTQIDYEREMAFVATADDGGDAEETLGVARALADPDNVEAEFGIVVRSDLKGGGLGAVLMHKLIAYLRQRDTGRLTATVLAENDRMLELARELGFEVTGTDVDTVSIEMPLGPAAASPTA